MADLVKIDFEPGNGFLVYRQDDDGNNHGLKKFPETASGEIRAVVYAEKLAVRHGCELSSNY